MNAAQPSTDLDLVNAFFRQFYPANWQDRSQYEYTTMLGGMKRYVGRPFVDTIFPGIECNDGFHVSVQGHAGSYCTPRDDFAEKYITVECGFPSEREELLMPFIDGDETTDPTSTVYGYVPVPVVIAVIEKHGGLKGAFVLDQSAQAGA